MKLRTFTIIIALLSVVVMKTMAQGNVIIKVGSIDGDKWTVKDGATEVTPSSTPVTEGNTVKLNYTGARRVKSVRVIKQVPPSSIAYMKWDDGQKSLVEATTLGLVNKVTASESDVNWAAGTYIVNENVTINGDITVNGNVSLIIGDGKTLTVNGQIKDGTARAHDLNIYCQGEQTGAVVATNASASVFEDFNSLNIHGVKVTATCSNAGSGGISNVKLLNIYIGELTAKNTTEGYGVLLYDSESKLNLYDGKVTVEGKGSVYAGIQSNTGQEATITIYEGKFNVSNPDGKALANVAIGKDAAFGGTLCDSDDENAWGVIAGTHSDKKYVKVEFLTDLAGIISDYTVKNGESLIGILNAEVKISIADGATVTLYGVNINADGEYVDGEFAGLTCLGNATIILAEGSTNEIRGFLQDYPGIYVPENKTLTIKGEGTLFAYPGDPDDPYAAGIGAGYEISCGNIRIEGGNITAIGGNGSAGIGSGQSFEGDKGNCGNITIVGGTVTAIGGECAAGIGSGSNTSCGKITIKNTVIKVTATAGEDNTESIGASDSGTCDGVDIEDGAIVVQNNN